MSLYAIGDLHLHFQSELKSPGQLNGRVWRDHEKVFAENCRRMIRDEDTLLLLGDHSWGKNLTASREDLEYIAALPGRKILLRGNHDAFWEASKTPALNAMYKGRLFFLQNNFAEYGTYAIVGTKGYIFEGPFMVDRRTGRVVSYDTVAREKAEKLVDRETDRLQRSFDAACQAGYSRFIMILHYPPTDILSDRSPYTRLAEKYGVEQVVYAHSHGEARFHDSLQGRHRGVEYHLASGDFLRWKPMRVL
ncbi:MAG: metallophosphoesterase [Clostridia bacterium]|nr:metallophosphoesterase [Clostridia bacterium]